MDSSLLTREGSLVYGDIFESSRRYVRVQLKGEGVSAEDVESMEVLATPTPIPDQNREFGPFTEGVPAPLIRPEPKAGELSAEVVDLSGQWRFCSQPSGRFWMPEADKTGWAKIRVPSFSVSSGEYFPDEPNNNREVACAIDFFVPESARDKRVYFTF